MKEQYQAAIQYSGYPLRLADQQQKQKALKAVRTDKKQAPLQKNTIADDPSNWDIDWFRGYE